MSGWHEDATGTNWPLPIRGWYYSTVDSEGELYWNGSKWTGQGWYLDPTDSTRRIYWDGSNWTGHRCSATEPPFIPREQAKKDWAKIAGMALGAAVVATSTVSNENAKRASFANDWDLGGAQGNAKYRQDQYNNYVRLHSQWIQKQLGQPQPPAATYATDLLMRNDRAMWEGREHEGRGNPWTA